MASVKTENLAVRRIVSDLPWRCFWRRQPSWVANAEQRGARRLAANKSGRQRTLDCVCSTRLHRAWRGRTAAEVTDAHEASGQHVWEETAQELGGSQRHLILLATVCVILPAEDDVFLFEGHGSDKCVISTPTPPLPAPKIYLSWRRWLEG